MKILVTVTPHEDDDVFYGDNWACNAEFETNEDSNVHSYIAMIARAMELETFCKETIAYGMINWMLDNEIDIDKIKEEL